MRRAMNAPGVTTRASAMSINGSHPGSDSWYPARAAADRMVFFDAGNIVEEGTPEQIFEDPQHDRTKLFLSQILTH
jgi:ABC-type sulfate/molybdate transport systems ATPase subunit